MYIAAAVGVSRRRRFDGLKFGASVHRQWVRSSSSAAERDRPGVYVDYVAADMAAPTQPDLQALERHDFNCLTCVAALGFGDVPPAASRR